MSMAGLISHPSFVISLDTELLWGCTAYPGHKATSLLLNDEEKGRGIINSLLKLFEKHNIAATWAIVGHLFLDYCERENSVLHKKMLRSRKSGCFRHPYTVIYRDPLYIRRDPLYYGRDIVDRILSSPVKHEIASHSFSHIRFSECTQKVAEAEVKEAVRLANDLGITLKSFVFPENMIGHVNILKKYGFKVYRGKKIAFSNQNFAVRMVKVALAKIIAPPVEARWMDGIWELPASMLFYDPIFPFTLLIRAKLGVIRAIREKKIFHVYLHPYNLLMDPSLLEKLNRLLAFVAKRRQRGEITVNTMGEIASRLGEK